MKVFVVEGLICWACDGELGVGFGSWLCGEWTGDVLRSGNGCVGGRKIGKLWFTGGSCRWKLWFFLLSGMHSLVRTGVVIGGGRRTNGFVRAGALD